MKKVDKKVRRTSIGGQAVMEGVMMRGESSMAVSVRDSNGDIRTETGRVVPVKRKNLFFRLPVVRGVVNFISMMVMGVSILTKSAEVYAEGEEPVKKKEKKNGRKKKENAERGEPKKDAGMGFAMVAAVLLGLGLAVALFFILPTLITDKLFTGVFGWQFNPIVQNLIEGAVRFAIFLGYLLLVSLMKDIRRTFMYHGAEHRTINCFESGAEMTVENVQKCSTVHNRCGTTFIFFVMLMSIIIFALFDGLVTQFGAGAFLDNVFYKILTKLALLPLVAGLSYELLKGLAKTDFWLFWPLKAPGMLLQKITTKKPTDDMVEVALASFNAVLAMDADESVSAVKFRKIELSKNYYERIKRQLKSAGIEDVSETDWMFCKALNCKRGDILLKEKLTIGQMEQLDGFASERLTGKPLQYVLGETEFYGYPIRVNENVLIPRFDTELLAEQALMYASGRQTLLDLCTGSGAIAVACAKKTALTVTGSDVSEAALSVARENGEANNAAVEWVQSDLFTSFADRRFDIIVSNPPYIAAADMEKLQKEVTYEPRLAVYGGEDGLSFYRRIAQEADKHLTENGILLLEVGYDQAEEVAALFTGGNTEIKKDLSGIERMVIWSKN